MTATRPSTGAASLEKRTAEATCSGRSRPRSPASSQTSPPIQAPTASRCSHCTNRLTLRSGDGPAACPTSTCSSIVTPAATPTSTSRQASTAPAGGLGVGGGRVGGWVGGGGGRGWSGVWTTGAPAGGATLPLRGPGNRQVVVPPWARVRDQGGVQPGRGRDGGRVGGGWAGRVGRGWGDWAAQAGGEEPGGGRGDHDPGGQAEEALAGGGGEEGAEGGVDPGLLGQEPGHAAGDGEGGGGGQEGPGARGGTRRNTARPVTAAPTSRASPA